MSRAINDGQSAISLPRCVAAFVLLLAVTAAAQDAKQRLLERVFGDAVRLDPAMVAKVKAAKPGQRFFVDRNGDGRNDECWFIDTSLRHTDAARPILVRAIDEDGDLDAWNGPELASDLYVADWNADGTADVVIDYQDDDHDGDVDEMAMYFFVPEQRHFGRNVLMAWWGRDDGDDNQLWYDVNYTYYQTLCQYRCHFSGDETFVAFGLRESDTVWQAGWENPFLFYDPDHDGCAEVVLRIEGKGDRIRAARYSFDADDDAYGTRTHDYDFSITAVADDDKLLTLPPDMTESTTLVAFPRRAGSAATRPASSSSTPPGRANCSPGTSSTPTPKATSNATRTSAGKASSRAATIASHRSAARPPANSTSATSSALSPSSRCGSTSIPPTAAFT